MSSAKMYGKPFSKMIQKIGVVLGLATVAGYVFLGIDSMTRSPTPLRWTEREMKEQSGKVDIPKIYGRKFCDNALTIDIDGDNDVDALMFAQSIFRYDKSKEKELRVRYNFERDAKEMTPTLKELANRVMHTQQDFARHYLIENNAYVRRR